MPKIVVIIEVDNAIAKIKRCSPFASHGTGSRYMEMIIVTSCFSVVCGMRS